jgi:hypothetical protein
LILNSIAIFETGSFFFDESLFATQLSFFVHDYSCFLYLDNGDLQITLQFLKEPNLHTKSLVTFINQTEDMAFFKNLENVQTIYHYSIPNTKLFYPEPFIASASFMHTDL